MANRLSLAEAQLLARCWREGQVWTPELEPHWLFVAQDLQSMGLLSSGIGFTYRLTTAGILEIYDLTVRHIDQEMDLTRKMW